MVFYKYILSPQSINFAPSVNLGRRTSHSPARSLFNDISTNVPIETEVTELMHRISLKQEANYWATAMKKVTDMSGDRRSRASEFINAGYTHEATKSDLLNMYEKRIK